MDKSLVVNMLKFEATTKDSHLPPITRSVVEEMVHKTEARVRTKPTIRAVPDTVKLYQKMKKRGIFTVGISANSKVEDHSFKVNMKGFNSSNLPENLTYTCTKQSDEVCVEVKRESLRKTYRHFDDGLIWPKFTRNNTMILPKLSYGGDNKRMKSLVPPEVEGDAKPEPEVTPTPTQNEAKPTEKEKSSIKDSVTVSLISIGQVDKADDTETPRNKEEDKIETSSETKDKETPRPGPVLRQVTIGIDIPEPNPDTKRRKEIRSMYPMYDSNEEKREIQRQHWWEKRSNAQVTKTTANTHVQQPIRPTAQMFLAPVTEPHAQIVDDQNKNETKSDKVKFIVPSKEYINADEIGRHGVVQKSSEDYLNMPNVFEKHLEVVKATIAQSRGGLSPAKSPRNGIQGGPSFKVTGLTPASKSMTSSTDVVPTVVPPPSAATVAFTDDGLNKVEATDESCVSGPGSVADPVTKVEIEISDDGLSKEGNAGNSNTQEKAIDVPGSGTGETGLTVNDGSDGHSTDGHPVVAHRESLSAQSQHSGLERGADRPSGLRRRTSSFLELPESPRDPNERPPSIEGDVTDGQQDTKSPGSPHSENQNSANQPPKRRTSSFLEPPGSPRNSFERPPSKSESMDFNPQEESVFGDTQPALASPRLSRRPTPEILVSTEAEELEVPHIKDVPES